MPSQPAATPHHASMLASPDVAAETQRTPFRPGQLQTMRTPSDAQLSPDGRHVAFTLLEWVPERPRMRGRLWIVEAAGGEPRPLAKGGGEDSCPRWSPDSQSVAFLSTRDDEKQEKAQPYIVPLATGVARRVCVLPNGATNLTWSPDGARLAILALDGDALSADPIIARPDRHRRLWTVRVDNDTPTAVTPPDATIWEYAWSPASDRFALFYSHGPNETDYYRGQLGVVSVGGGAIHQIARLTRQAAALTWSPDGARLGYISGEWSDRGLVGGDIYTLALSGGEPRNLTPGVTCSPSWIRWFPDGQRLLYAAWDGTSHQIGVLDEASGARTPLQRAFAIGDWAWPRLSASADLSRIALTHTVATEHPFDVFVGDLAASAVTWRRLSRLNPLAEETISVSPSQTLRYASVDGWEIEGLFTPPVGASGEGKPPLAVLVHGGPTSGWVDTWTGGFLTQLLAGAGYAVFRPNPRGGLGYGVQFADAVLGDMGGKDYQDILRGVDEVVARGLADGARMAILGWSYGGFMVAWAVSHTDRFKAAMMGAGVCDFHSFHAQSNIPDWDMRFLAATPTEQPEVYRERSAITYAKNITTPTLILHGANDLCVPVNQAHAFHVALSERHVPVELAIYPREGHGIQERDHIRDMEERILRWLATHLN